MLSNLYIYKLYNFSYLYIMHQFLLSNIYSNSKVVRLAIIIGFIICLNLIFKYINPNFKNIEKLDKLLDINTLETNIIENIKSYLNISVSLITIISPTVTITNKLNMKSKLESLKGLINTQLNIELSVFQGRTLDDKNRLNNIKELFNDYNKIYENITDSIFKLYQYINTIYNVNTTLNIYNLIMSRDNLFDITNNQINNFIDLNIILFNDNENIIIVKKLINESLIKIQLHLSYYNIIKLIEKNIEQIKKYDIQINTDPPLQNINQLKLSRVILYNKINNIVDIEIANRSNTDLKKAAFNLYHDNLVKLNQ